MTDIVERLRREVPHCDDPSDYGESDLLILKAADEIERLREALQSTSTMIELMCKAFDLSPDDFVIKVNANKENGETRVVTSISAQEVLDKARAALGEKE
jgi:hypothetical protein